MTPRTGWAIDRDYYEAAGSPYCRIGYGQVDGQEGGSSCVTVATGLRVADIQEPVRFRLLDDDGEVYYGGAIAASWLEGDEDRAFGPLSFGAADAGCTEMQYRNGHGDWETL